MVPHHREALPGTEQCPTLRLLGKSDDAGLRLLESHRLRQVTGVGFGLAASAALAATSLIDPDPVTPIGVVVLAVLVVSAVARPFVACLAFIVLTFFRIHEAYPVLFDLRLPFMLGAATMLGLAIHVFVVRSVTLAWPREMQWFAAFVLVVTAGLLFAYDRQVAWTYWSDVYWKIALMTLAVAWLPGTARDFQAAAIAFVLGGISVAAVAIYNRYYGIDLVELTRVTIGRQLNSFLGDPNDLALVLLFPLSFSLALVYPGNRAGLRLLGVVAVVMIVLAVIFTQSRGGLLGVLAVAGAYAMRRLRSKTLVVAFTIGAAFFLYAVMGISSRISGGGGGLETLDQSASERLLAWEAAIAMALDRPLTGVGLANFAAAFFAYAENFPGRDMTAHNTFFGVLGETGAPGFVIFVGMVAATFRSAWTAHKALAVQPAPPIVASFAFALLAGLAGFCVSGFFLTQGFSWPIYLLVGLTAAVGRYATALQGKMA